MCILLDNDRRRRHRGPVRRGEAGRNKSECTDEREGAQQKRKARCHAHVPYVYVLTYLSSQVRPSDTGNVQLNAQLSNGFARPTPTCMGCSPHFPLPPVGSQTSSDFNLQTSISSNFRNSNELTMVLRNLPGKPERRHDVCLTVSRNRPVERRQLCLGPRTNWVIL